MHVFSLCMAWTVAGLLGQAESPTYPDKKNLLILRDAVGKESPIRTADQWAERRAHILSGMERVMGTFPKWERGPIDIKILEVHDTPDYVRQKITYQSSPGNRVPGYLFLPKKFEGPRPAVLCLHPTSRDLGSGVPAGLGPKEDRHYAVALAKRGFVTFAPDYVKSGTYTFDAYENGFVSATMLGIWNHSRAVDLLVSLPQVDGKKIGVIGHSLGGHNSLFVAAFDTRIGCVVSNCGFCSFPTYMKGNIKGWSHDGYMPLINTKFGLDPAKMPFDFPEVVAAIAPRAFLASAPLRDHNFDAQGAKDCVEAARPVYELLGAKDKLDAIYPDCDHNFPPSASEPSYRWLEKWLK